jgi:AP endonuclease-1
MNVCREDVDLARPNENRNKTAGFTDKERQSFELVLNSGAAVVPPDTTKIASKHKTTPESSTKDAKDNLEMFDVWREMHPDQQEFTYFSRRFQCREKRIGWRLDYICASRQLQQSIKDCEILDKMYGPSDHCPVLVRIDRQAIMG